MYFLITIFSGKLTWLPFVYESNFRVADLATLAGQAKHSALPLTVLALFNIAVLI